MADEIVLFVDDEKSILNSIERLFHDDDMNVRTVDSAEKALGVVTNENVAVVVSDNMMPGMSGVEFLSKTRLIAPDAMRILMTGQADLGTAIDAINKGEVFRFVLKPWDGDVLRQTVQEAVERYRIVHSLKRADEATMLSLAQTIELKDEYTRGHCDRVAGFSMLMAEALNLSEEMKRDIQYGSWLHDCGKIGIPESILNKEGPLEEKEFETIKNHPVWGADVAKQAQLSEVIINIILYHHEKCDGSGYPTGISGEKIPVEAKIVAVADVFDAITTDRAYRKAHSFEKGIEILSSMKEGHLNAEIVELFISCIRSARLEEVKL